VTVSDTAAESPVTVFAPGHDLDRGRGLTIVAALASRWGIEREQDAKEIWFELDLGSRSKGV
jgi:hypothetical protein